MLPLWRHGIAPKVAQGQTVLVVAHANSIRSLIYCIDKESIGDNLGKISIPSALPLIYDFEVDNSVPYSRSNVFDQLKTLGEPSILGMRGRYLSSMELIGYQDIELKGNKLSSFPSLEGEEMAMVWSQLNSRLEAAGINVEKLYKDTLNRQKTKNQNKKASDVENGSLEFENLIEHSLQTAINYANGYDIIAEPTEVGETLSIPQIQGPGGGADEALAILDRQGNVFYVNKLLCALTGFTSADLIGKSAAVVIGKVRNSPIYRIVNERISSGLSVKAQMVNYRKDGTPFINRFTVLPIFNYMHVKPGSAEKSNKVDETWSDTWKGLGPTHFVTRLDLTPDRKDLDPLLEEELKARDDFGVGSLTRHMK
jgi:PAS domain S-box-containing protein